MAGRIAPNCNGRLPIEGREFAYNEEPIYEARTHLKLYEGYEIGTNRRICIKKDFHISRIPHELKILKTLDHPHIVRHLASQEKKDNFAYIVMDFARAASLEKTDRTNFRQISSIKIFAHQLFEALKYLDSQNIIHNDLSHKNIFWDPKTNALTLIDFDAAQRVREEKRIVKCTFSFAAPEVLLNKKNHSLQADLWSAGCVIYYLFEGFLFGPNDDSVLKNVVAQIGRPTREFLSDCENYDLISDDENPPPCLQETLRTMLETRNLDEAEQNQWIDLFSSLIRYESRGKAEDYLKHPLFASLIKIDVVVEQAMSLSISQGEEVVYSEDFTHKARECVHLTSSPEYTLTAKMGGEEKTCNLPLKEGEILHVKSLFAEPNDPKAAEPSSKKSKTDD